MISFGIVWSGQVDKGTSTTQTAKFISSVARGILIGCENNSNSGKPLSNPSNIIMQGTLTDRDQTVIRFLHDCKYSEDIDIIGGDEEELNTDYNENDANDMILSRRKNKRIVTISMIVYLVTDDDGEDNIANDRILTMVRSC